MIDAGQITFKGPTLKAFLDVLDNEPKIPVFLTMVRFALCIMLDALSRSGLDGVM